MGICRTYDASCDKCGDEYDDPYGNLDLLKESLRRCGWTVDRKVLCGYCNGKWERDIDEE